MKAELSFATLSIEARTEVIREAMESTLWSLEKSEKEIEFLRARLQEQKDALGHGRWLPWIRETFGDDNGTIRKIQRFLQKPNATLLTYLEDAETGEQQTAIVPRESRKPATVKVSPVGQQPVQTDDIDDDPTPDPPTIRKTAAGSQKVKEADKPKPRPMVPEVLTDEPEPSDPIQEWIETHTLSDLVTLVVAKTCSGDDAPARKKAAKELRKLADKLDPPTKFTRPDLEEVSAYFRELNAADPDSFFDFYESKGWMVGKVSMKDWRASARKWVRENQANPFGNGKANGNGHKRGSSADDFIARNAAKLRETFGCD